MNIDYQAVIKKAEDYQPDICNFLREIIAIPSKSGNEKNVVLRIKEEMQKIGFDRIEIDSMGNILGYIGHGKHLIAMDAHIDTVGAGELNLWKHDPYLGYEDEQIIMGRGASDQKGGMASLLYAGKIIKDLRMEDDYTLLITGTVQEEDCEGLCWQYIINDRHIKPEFVVITEPTSLNIHRGQRGRTEIEISTYGVSCHGSAPERGENAIYKMLPIIKELENLHDNLKGGETFLGKGSLTVSEISSASPSRCAVPDRCTIFIDRRLTLGESPKDVMGQINSLSTVKEVKAHVSIADYSNPSYTGLVTPIRSYFSAWQIEEEHTICRMMVDTCKRMFKSKPKIDKWVFSTNGVSIMGTHGIPCIGYGPGREDQAHAPNEKVEKSELVKAAAIYAVIPKIYLHDYRQLNIE